MKICGKIVLIAKRFGNYCASCKIKFNTRGWLKAYGFLMRKKSWYYAAAILEQVIQVTSDDDELYELAQKTASVYEMAG